MSNAVELRYMKTNLKADTQRTRFGNATRFRPHVMVYGLGLGVRIGIKGYD